MLTIAEIDPERLALKCHQHEPCGGALGRVTSWVSRIAQRLVAASRGIQRNHRRDPCQEATVRIGSVILVVWFIIGLIAAGQRGYFSGASSNCARAGDTIITVLAGPLNYVGVNPKIKCTVPQPSK